MAAAKRKENKHIENGATSVHITNLKQPILETFDIYAVALLILATLGGATEITPGAIVIKLFCPYFTDFRNKLVCLSLASLSSLV
jgi:hypothetical protein